MISVKGTIPPIMQLKMIHLGKRLHSTVTTENETNKKPTLNTDTWISKYNSNTGTLSWVGFGQIKIYPMEPHRALQ